MLFLATSPTPFAKEKVKEPTAEMPWKPTVVSADDRVEKLTSIRKAMVKSMQDALSIPHFGYCDEIFADALIGSSSLDQEFFYNKANLNISLND